MMAMAVCYELKIPLHTVLLWKISDIKNQYFGLRAYLDICEEQRENGNET